MANQLLLSCLILSLTFILGVYSDNLRHYDGYTVLRLLPKSTSQLKYLHDLEAHHYELNFWKSPSAVNRPVDVMVPPHLKHIIEKVLKKKNIPFQTMIKDVEKLAAEERLVQKNTSTKDLWDSYQRYDAIESFLESTASANSAIAQTESVGKSYENRDIKIIKIGEGVADKTKPIIFIDSGIHAREWIGPAFTTYLVQELIDGYTSGNSDIKPLVQKFDWYIVPVVNPDGYEYTHTNDRMWRKTRKPSSTTCVGTDPNRNFGYEWGGAGASTNPCSETYRGENAFSEPETKSLSDYITAIKDRVKLYTAVHSYGQYWLYPWGYTSALTNDDTALNKLGTTAVTALTAVSGTRYTIGTSTNVLYAAAGGADDWTYGAANVKYSYTVELRDLGTYGFQLPASQIKPCSIETVAGYIAMAKALATELNL